jgi:RHS repeat-associated protein
VAQSDYTYDPLSRLTALTHHQGSTTLAGYTWTYDSAGQLTQYSSTADGTATYTYDANGQLTGEDYSFQTDESHTYDANGNRTNSGYSTGTNNRLLSDGTYNYQYDNEGNRTRRTNIATGEVTEYTWDYRNRLTAVTFKDSQGNVTKSVQYTYDAFNRLVSRTVDADGDGEQTATSTYSIYDGQQVALEFDSTGAVERRYLSGPAVDQVLAEETAAGVVEWLLADHEGTIRDVAEHDSQTHETTVVNHLTYDAFGNITSQTNAAKQPHVTYTGRYWDADAGLYYYRARWYDPIVGRFISEDPKGFAAGDPNLLRYVKNSPLTHVDPTGMDSCETGQVGAYPGKPEDPPGWITRGEIRELARHCYGNTEMLSELETLILAAVNAKSSYGWGGWCAGWLDNFFALLPPIFRGHPYDNAFNTGNSLIKVTPVWFAQGDPGFWSGLGGYLRGVPSGHYAARVEFPDGFVVYLDDGWEGTGGVFTFQAGTAIPTATRPLWGETALGPGDRHGWPDWW